MGIVAAFAIFLAGTAALVFIACGHKVDLVSVDYYEQEIHYQTQIDRLDRARRLAIPASVAYDAARHRIAISLPIAHAQRHAAGRVALYRPSAAGLDREMKLEPDAQGIHSLDTRLLQPGLWKVRVSWRFEEQDYLIDQPIIIGSRAS